MLTHRKLYSKVSDHLPLERKNEAIIATYSEIFKPSIGYGHPLVCPPA